MKKLMSLHIMALSLGMNPPAIAGQATETTLMPVPALPEDIVALKNSPWLLVSAMAPRGIGQGGLYALHSDTGAVQGLLPAETAHDADAYPNCSTAPANMSPHGINLRAGNAGPELLAVNHGDREAIEIFRVDSEEHLKLAWIGCIPLPDSVYANGVTPMPGGQVAVTSIFDPSSAGAEQEMLGGAISGGVLLWQASTGWKALGGTALAGANGIVASDDGKVLYVASWTTRQVYRFEQDPDAGNWLGTFTTVPFLPDNLRWDDESFVLVTGQASTPVDVARCARQAEGCSRGITVLRLHPDSLALETRFDGGEMDLGDATVAVDRQGTLFIGNLQQHAVIKVENR